jgi:hypothetical protein
MPLTKEQQRLAFGVGGTVLGAGVLYWLFRPKEAYASASPTSTSPLDTGIYVHPNCTSWDITNPAKLTLTLTPVVDALVLAGERNPWKLAEGMQRRIAPQCVLPPTKPRSPFEAYLFYRLILEAICELRRRNLITQVEGYNHWAQADAWALFNDVPNQNLYEYSDTCGAP